MTAPFMTQCHERLRDEVRRFAEAEVAPRVEEMERNQRVHVELSQLISRQGWIGVTIDRRYGGTGLGHVAKTVIIEELSRVCGAMGAMVQASQLGVAKIAHFGSEKQQRTWLPSVAEGRCLPTIAVTEPESGGHVLGMSTTAEIEGGDYVLSGHKAWVGNSAVGDLHGVVARTGSGSRGLSAFLVEADRPGVSVGEHVPSLGLHGFSFGDVHLDRCRVPRENLVGAEGDGLAVAYSSSVLYGRPNLTAVALGIHRAIVEDTLAFTERQHRYGQPLFALPAVQQKLGRMRSQLMTARLVAYHAVHLLDRGLPCDAELMNAKLVNVESTLDAGRVAMEIQAAYGLHSSIGRYVRDAHHLFAPAGTSDVQRLRLAEMAREETTDHWWSRRLAERLKPDPGPW